MFTLNHLAYIGIQKEAVWGVPIFSALDFGTHQSDSILVTPTPIVAAGINNTPTMNKRVAGLKVVSGGFPWEVGPEDLTAELLKHTFSKETFVDDGVGNGGQHTFAPRDLANPLPPGLTIQLGRGRTDAVRNAFGYRISTLTFSLDPDGLLLGTVEGTAKDEAAGVLQTPVYSLENEFFGSDVNAILNVDGATACIRSFTMAIATGLVGDRRCLGTNLIQQQAPGVYDVTGSFGLFYEDEVIADKVRNHAPFSIDIELRGTLIGTTQRLIKFDIPNAQFNGASPTTPGREGELLLELGFQAIRKAGSELATIKVNNSVRSAY